MNKTQFYKPKSWDTSYNLNLIRTLTLQKETIIVKWHNGDEESIYFNSILTARRNFIKMSKGKDNE